MAQYVFSTIDEFSHMCLNSKTLSLTESNVRIDLLVIDEDLEWEKSQTLASVQDLSMKCHLNM